MFSLSSALVGALYTDISRIIEFLGGICGTSIGFVFPALISIKTCELPVTHWRNIMKIICFGSLSIVGYIAGALSAKGIVEFYLYGKE